MNRRDMIIIATLLNGAILALLFMLASSSEEPISGSPLTFVQNDKDDKEKSVTSSSNTLALMPPQLAPSISDEQARSHDIVKDFHAFEIPTEELFLSEEDDTLFQQRNHKIESSHHHTIVDVTVKSGDVLERIARVNGTTVEAIKALNNLRSEKLRVGQILKVPVGGTSSTLEASEPTKIHKQNINNQEESYYTIKSGDNPWKIARRFHVNMEDLLRLNNLNEEKARNLKVGDRVRIR